VLLGNFSAFKIGIVLEDCRRTGQSAFIDVIELLALTGCRKSEIARLKWTEVDLAGGFLRLDDSKVGARIVPLGEAAVQFLAARKDAAYSVWVFPSSRGAGPLIGVQKAWSLIRARAELPTLRLHDLRHSFASQAINSGASLYLTGAVLGHRQASTTQRYAHLQASPVRAVASAAAAQIAEALQGAKT
jgi:integrase